MGSKLTCRVVINLETGGVGTQGDRGSCPMASAAAAPPQSDMLPISNRQERWNVAHDQADGARRIRFAYERCRGEAAPW